MPTIDIGDEKLIRGFISEKGSLNKKKIDFYLELLTHDINSKYEFSILNNKNFAKIDILDKTKALKIFDDKLIFRGSIESVEDIIYGENNNLGVCLKNIKSKDIYIKSKSFTSLNYNDLTEVKHNCKVIFNTSEPISKKEIANKKSSENIANSIPISHKKNKFNFENEEVEKKEVTVTLSEAEAINNAAIEDNKKESDSINNMLPIKLNINDIDTKDCKLVQTKELLISLYSKSIICKESKNKGRDTFAFKISYFNFKKVSLCENIYYTPVDLIVTMFKNQIMHYGKFMICVILKKNSSYIKHIQIGIPADKNEVKLEGLNDCKFFFNKDEGIGYWLINYEP